MLAERVLQGDVRAAARLMRWLDDRKKGAIEELRRLYPHTGSAEIIGVTGSPGCGKSTLVDRLIEYYRKGGRRVGVIAIDPTSPFSGGAILGDRIRMQQHSLDPGVFIRSLATRGAMGGLSRSTADIVTVLDAFGMDVIVIETVGVGQDEVDITRMADTSLVVTVPGLGDEIQAIKAGIMEIGDIFVVNKADKEGADRAVRDIRQMLELRDFDESAWRPPILLTEAIHGRGIEEVAAAVSRHREHLISRTDFEGRLRNRLRNRFLRLLREEMLDALLERLEGDGQLDELVERLLRKEIDPYGAAAAIIECLSFDRLRSGGSGSKARS